MIEFGRPVLLAVQAKLLLCCKKHNIFLTQIYDLSKTYMLNLSKKQVKGAYILFKHGSIRKIPFFDRNSYYELQYMVSLCPSFSSSNSHVGVLPRFNSPTFRTVSNYAKISVTTSLIFRFQTYTLYYELSLTVDDVLQ